VGVVSLPGREPELSRREALEQVAFMQGLLGEARASAAAAGYPALVVWAVVWPLAYCGSLAVRWLWIVVVPVGFAVHAAAVVRVAYRSPPRPAGLSPTMARRLAYSELVLFVLMGVLAFFLRDDPNVVRAYFPLFLGHVFVLYGLVFGAALIPLGVWFVALAAASLAMHGTVQQVWLGAAGGAGFLAGAMVLRREDRRARPTPLS
jgi:hypothetical protein